MKRNIFVMIIAFVACLFLFGCKNEETNTDYSVEELKNYAIESVHAYEYGTNDADEQVYAITVADDVKLPTSNPDVKNTKITWSSYDATCIDDNGTIIDRDSRKILNIDFECKVEFNGASIYIPFVFRLTSISLQTVCDRFEAQLPSLIFEDRTFTTKYDDIIEVAWTSSNEEAFSNEGKYTKLGTDSETIISFVASDSNNKCEGSKTIKVQGKTVMDLFNECKEWIVAEGVTETYLTKDINLPTKYEGKVDLTWTSSNERIMEASGKIHQTYYDQYVLMKCRISIDNHMADYKIQFKIAALDKTDELTMIKKVVSDIAVGEISKRVFLVYGNINQYFNAIEFCDGDLEIIEQMAPLSDENRPGIIKTSTEYITVHDTANTSTGANAKMHANYVGQGGGGTSWHYSIDQDNCYHQIPDNEVAYHAGDGHRVYGLIDTGIKATSVKPVIYLKDGTYHILGQDTKLRPFNNQDATSYDTAVYANEDINSLGIIIEIGENGNYYMGRTYYNSGYGLIANFGGNRNSIGIESCVNSGSDYGHTYRNLSILVANLCIQNNLSVDRVKGHHYFSGKPCPNSILTTQLWEDFLTLVSREKFVIETLKDYDFKWSAVSSNIDNKGYIKLSVNSGDEVKYKVDVKKGSSTVYSDSFTTIVK